MTFDLQTILRGKLEFRRRLAARPIEDKLRILDVLRERELAIRGKGQTMPARERDTARERMPGRQEGHEA